MERILSVGYQYNCSTSAIERAISYSSFFQNVEKDKNAINVDSILIKEIYKELDVDLMKTPIYNQCLWAAEAYIRIQQACRYTFELIFLYLPIKKMYDYFPLYHEMDFSQIIEEFKRLHKKESVLSLLVNKYKYSLVDISNSVGIPYDSLYSLKQRRRDIKKCNIMQSAKLANILNIRIETIAEIKLV